MKSFKRSHSIYIDVLRKTAKIQKKGPADLKWYLQKFVFLINEYTRIKFVNEEIPR